MAHSVFHFPELSLEAVRDFPSVTNELARWAAPQAHLEPLPLAVLPTAEFPQAPQAVVQLELSVGPRAGAGESAALAPALPEPHSVPLASQSTALCSARLAQEP